LRTILIILFFLESIICLGQTIYLTRDSVHIFWQPDLKITFSDYKGTASEYIERDMAKYGYSVSASVGIWRVLDVAKRMTSSRKHILHRHLKEQRQ
jgi:hypothetical protein